jgi:hypothetical protein
MWAQLSIFRRCAHEQAVVAQGTAGCQPFDGGEAALVDQSGICVWHSQNLYANMMALPSLKIL